MISALKNSFRARGTSAFSPTLSEHREVGLRWRAVGAYARSVVAIRRQKHPDHRGRSWSVVIAPAEQAAALDAAFWDELSPEERVVAVHACTESALKAQGIRRVPRFRRVARVVER